MVELTKIESPRLWLRQFEMADAEEVFNCITPTITRFMGWDPPRSFDEYKSLCERRTQTDDQKNLRFVIRHKSSLECLGIVGLESIADPSPELGIWLKETAHGHGYGREAVRAIAEWGSRTLRKQSFIYPVAVQNTGSRRIAEELNGKIIGQRTTPKYDSVVYNIPALNPSNADRA